MRKKISIVTACYNEEDNVEELYIQVKQQFDTLPEYDYEHIFIDNASKDNTVAILHKLAEKDKNVKLILKMLIRIFPDNIFPNPCPIFL